MNQTTDSAPTRNTEVIPLVTARTLDGLFRERVRRSPAAVAYRDYDVDQGKWRDYT